MSEPKPSYEELQERLARADSTLEALRRGEVDLVIGATAPMVVRFKFLVEENERLAREWQTTFDALKDAVWILDANQRVTRTNQTAVQLFQRPADAMLGRHCWEIVHGVTEPVPECPILRMRRSLRRETLDLRMGERWFEVTVDPVLDAEERLTGAVHIISDITERKRAEEALRESEEKFKQVFESANVGKSITLPTGELNVNRAFADWLGYTPEELQNRTWRELTPQDEIEAVQEMIDPLLQGEKDAVRFEKRYIHKDGSHLWADVSVAIRRDQEENPLYFITTVVDVNARKRAEEELRLSEELFSNAFHVGPAGMSITRIADGKFIDVNESFLKLFGFSREEVIGHTSTELKMWSPEERESLIQKQSETGGLRDFELTAISKSGKPVNLLFSSQPMTLRGESCLITTMIDITERKRAEAKMAEQLHELQRWHAVMLDREGRIIELKREVNELLTRAGQPPRYASAEEN